MKKKIISTIDCTPDWLPLVKSYRKECTDYDGAMESFSSLILDCATNLDRANKLKKESEVS